MAIEIAKILRNNCKTHCFLSKGYGGKFRGVAKLDRTNRSAFLFGDEALLLCEYGDTFVSKDRVKGLKYINKHYSYDYIIVDDGLQNPTFAKDKTILMIYGEFGFGNGFLLPAGPLRETFSSACGRHVDLVVIVGRDKHNIHSLCTKYSVASLGGTIELMGPADRNFNGQYVAFCGIGHPEKFRKTLSDHGVNFIKFVAFGDHHRYSANDLKSLREPGYTLITTKKDWVKINDLNINKNAIEVAEVFLKIDRANILEDIIFSR
jgi:tetraacyldisaccharide 4'-kinase